MKLQMAKNSLFAVLLRSPWWISLVVALAFVLAARALLPPQYVVFGAIGAFPFLGIGLFAAWKQLRQPGTAQVDRILEVAAGMNTVAFGDALETAYRQQGYEVNRLVKDAATDLVLTKAGTTTLVAFKRWKASNHGVEPLRALVQARQGRDASHCVYVLLSGISDKTRRFAVDNHIDMLSGAALAQLLGKEILRAKKV